MYKKSYLFITIILFTVISTSCKKTEGEGGTSEIFGKVYLIRFDAGYTIASDTVPAPDEDVYIIYGNESSTYNDDFKTSFDGSFVFKYLLKGNYRIFAYTNDSTGAYRGIIDNSGPKVPVIIDVNLGSDESKSTPVIYIIDNNL